MATIGSVTKRPDGHYEGELKTLSVRADIQIVPIADKVAASQPDYRVLSQGFEIGAGWIRTGQIDRKSTRLNSSHIQKSRMPSSA